MGEFTLGLTYNQRKRELIKAASLLSASLFIVLFLRFAPLWVKQFYPVCILTKITKMYCPGCGTGRALEAMSRFDFKDAFLYNPFLCLIVIPLLVYLCVIYTLRAISGKHIPSLLSSPKSALPVLILITGIWVFRNVFPLSLSAG
jgi:hypothetical protein